MLSKEKDIGNSFASSMKGPPQEWDRFIIRLNVRYVSPRPK